VQIESAIKYWVMRGVLFVVHLTSSKARYLPKESQVAYQVVKEYDHTKD